KGGSMHQKHPPANVAIFVVVSFMAEPLPPSLPSRDGAPRGAHATSSSQRRHLLPVGDELQRKSVVAVAVSGGCRPILEDVTPAVSSMPGVSRSILSARWTTASVRSSEAPSASWIAVMMYAWSVCGMNPVGTTPNIVLVSARRPT